MIDIGIGFTVSLINFFLAAVTTKLVSTIKSLNTVNAVMLLSMIIRMSGIGIFFIVLYELGYYIPPILLGFIILYNILLGFEVAIIQQARTD